VKPIEASFHSWSTILQFDKPIPDVVVLKLVYNDMRDKSAAENLISEDEIPAVMTALIGSARKTVIFSSSMKRMSGHYSLKSSHFLNTSQRLKDALDRSIPAVASTQRT
jgi:hypothetical protein